MTHNLAPHIVLSAWRSRVLVILFLLCFLGLVGRSAYLQISQNEFYKQKGESRYSRIVEISAHRGMITDRNGEPLAISTPVESLWANPATVSATYSQLKKLSELIEVDVTEISKKIGNEKRDFVYLKRHLAPEITAKVVRLIILQAK